MKAHPVWDAPSRFIHWCFPVGIGLLWWSGETGRMGLPNYVAYILLTLVMIRLAIDFAAPWHATKWDILQSLMFVHLGAIAWYQWRKRQPMVQTMWQGQLADRISEHKCMSANKSHCYVKLKR